MKEESYRRNRLIGSTERPSIPPTSFLHSTHRNGFRRDGSVARRKEARGQQGRKEKERRGLGYLKADNIV